MKILAPNQSSRLATVPLPPAALPEGDGVHVHHEAPCLTADGFGVAFGSRVILAELDFEIAAGGVTVLMGPTGTGKSTLLRSLAGLNDANPNYKWWGSLEYRGRVLAAGNRPRLVQQHVRLMGAPVVDALAAEARLGRSMNMAEQKEWVHELVHRFDLPELHGSLQRTTIDLPPVLQRAVAILREAAVEPALLMVDEPTSGLDDQDAFLLLDLLTKVSERSAVLTVLHNQRHAQTIGRAVLMLAGGRIQEASDMPSFFEAPASPAARQFVQTGSCALPAPDADPETLAEDVSPPPPLPSVAKQAVRAAPESMGPRGFTWIIPGALAGTPMPGAVLDIDYDLQALKRVGVTCLITLTERDLDQTALRRNGLTNLHLPIRDREPPTVAQVTMLLKRMETLLAAGQVLAVHCLAGIGRTGTVLACWLIREGLTAAEALKRVRRVEPKFVQTTEQEQFLQQYEDWILQKLR